MRSFEIGRIFEIKLHTFVDASEISYAVRHCAISDILTADQLTVPWSRLKLGSTHSIPCLELKAALLGARLARHIIESHSIHVGNSILVQG